MCVNDSQKIYKNYIIIFDVYDLLAVQQVFLTQRKYPKPCLPDYTIVTSPKQRALVKKYILYVIFYVIFFLHYAKNLIICRGMGFIYFRIIIFIENDFYAIEHSSSVNGISCRRLLTWLRFRVGISKPLPNNGWT